MPIKKPENLFIIFICWYITIFYTHFTTLIPVPSISTGYQVKKALLCKKKAGKIVYYIYMLIYNNIIYTSHYTDLHTFHGHRLSSQIDISMWIKKRKNSLLDLYVNIYMYNTCTLLYSFRYTDTFLVAKFCHNVISPDDTVLVGEL